MGQIAAGGGSPELSGGMGRSPAGVAGAYVIGGIRAFDFASGRSVLSGASSVNSATHNGSIGNRPFVMTDRCGRSGKNFYRTEPAVAFFFPASGFR